MLLPQQLPLRQPEESQQVLPDRHFQHRVSSQQRCRLHCLPFSLHLLYDDGKLLVSISRSLLDIKATRNIYTNN